MVWSTRFEAYAGGQKAPRGGLDDDTLGAVLREYRRTVAKRYRVLSADLIERALPAGPLWISSKLDGELWFLVKRAGQVALCAYNGRVLVGTPLVQEAERWLKAQGDLVIAGELVAVPDEGRPRVQHVATALGRSEGEKSLSFFAFDLVQAEGKSAFGTPYAERMATLEKLFCKGERIQVVLTVRGESSDAASYYREWVGTQRFEGIVVRSDVGLTYKIKPMFSLDAVLVAYGARVTSGVAELREMSVALRRDDGSLQLLGSVGGGFAAGDRVAWYQRLMAMEVKSAFRMANRDGTLCRFVRPEIVVEIQCSDLLDTDGNEVPITRMTLSYSEADGYKPLGDARTAAMLFPVFLRERTDKTPDLASIGMTQVTSRIALDDAGPVASVSLPDSQVVRRGVWTKAGKAVRKFVVLETKKSAEDGFPKFVVYFTDYSADRAEPLKTSLRAASTLARAEEHVVAWVEDNVKRGWAPANEVQAKAAVEPTEARAKPKKRSTKG